jgi:uncharacterized protein (DUF1501 family)
MALDPRGAALALHRFGLGPRAGTIAAIASDLHEKRDLKATTDLRAVLKGLLKDHLRVEERVLAADIFPGSEGVGGVEGLVA